jgi:hypothetical protein
LQNINGSGNGTTNGQGAERNISTVSTTMAGTQGMTAKFMTHPNEPNCCISNDANANTSNLYTSINSHATNTTNVIDSPIISTTTRIKPKSSTFLHRDYNRKPILARSQVSKSLAAEML